MKRTFKSPGMRLFKTIGLVMTLGMMMSACAQTGRAGADTWKEEALQPDGSKLVVERSVTRKGRHEIGQKPPIGAQSLTFAVPGLAEQVKWEDNYSEALGGANFNLMFVGVVRGAAYVVSTPAGCLSYNQWGRPNPPYVVFKYLGKEWQRVPVKELPLAVALPNLIISSPDDEVEKSDKRFITAEMVMKMNQGFSQPQYKTILREALAIQPCPQYPTGPKPPIPVAPIGLQK